MVKKIILSVVGIVVVTGIFLSVTLSNRHFVYKLYRGFNFYMQMNSNYSENEKCQKIEETQALQNCLQEIVRQSGGFKSADDYGIALGVMFKIVNKTLDQDPAASFKGMSILLVELVPDRFWINQQDNEDAQIVFSDEKLKLKNALMKNRAAIEAEKNANPKFIAAKLETRYLLDLKISELEK